MKSEEINIIRRWWIFTQERFEPVSSLSMILLFVAAHFVVSGNFTLQSLNRAIPLFTGVTVFFFKLRLYDEIKDYETDKVINPARPLPRGLLDRGDLGIMILICIVAELLLFGLMGRGALIGISLAIFYSLLMYKEFFIRYFIRRHLTTYAVSHTVVTVLLGMAMMAAVRDCFIWELSSNDLWFVFNNWFMFNIFEFGRKTFLSGEERENVESYSRIFGRYGAVMLVLSQLILSAICIWHLDVVNLPMKIFVGVTIMVMTVIGGLYAVLDRRPWGAVYRGYSKGHIVVFFTGFIICAFL